MSKYNETTKNADITVKLIERDDRNDKSVWAVTLKSTISFVDRDLPEGTTFKYEGGYDETEDEAYGCIMAGGLLDACNITDAQFERDLQKAAVEVL